jgi:cob(I)alamin adenosyltransferase
MRPFFDQSGYNFSMHSIHNHTGDDGNSGLLGEGRLPKYHPRLEALGVLDEASAALGLARALCKSHQNGALLKEIQRDLYSIMAEVAATPKNVQRFQILNQSRLTWLESQTDAIAASAPIPEEFILSGDSTSGAALDLARTIVRRAERRIAELLDTGELGNNLILKYLNRLSSFCFAMEILENVQAGKPTSLAKES